MGRHTSIIHKLDTAVRQWLGLPPPAVVSRLLGRELTVHKGSVRVHPDYDDAWLLSLARHAKIVVDVGANIGQAALLILSADSVQKLFVVDANSNALTIAAENLIRNGLVHRAQFMCAFVGDRADQQVDFWTIGAGAAGSVWKGHAQTAAKRSASITIPTVTLDSVCEEYSIVPDLVKVDVEGAEAMVLAGSQHLAAKLATRFILEMHSNPELTMTRNAQQVLDWCDKTGYRAFYLKDHIALDKPEQIQHRGRCHLLCQPADWSYPIWLQGVEQGASLESVTKA